MQNQRIQKKQSSKTKDNHSASRITETRDSSKCLSTNPSRFPVMRGDSRPDISITPQNVKIFQRAVGNRAVGRIIQAKLKIGQPGDKYEQEADRVPDDVSRMPEPDIRPKPT